MFSRVLLDGLVDCLEKNLAATVVVIWLLDAEGTLDIGIVGYIEKGGGAEREWNIVQAVGRGDVADRRAVNLRVGEGDVGLLRPSGFRGRWRRGQGAGRW